MSTPPVLLVCVVLVLQLLWNHVPFLTYQMCPWLRLNPLIGLVVRSGSGISPEVDTCLMGERTLFSYCIAAADGGCFLDLIGES